MVSDHDRLSIEVESNLHDQLRVKREVLCAATARLINTAPWVLQKIVNKHRQADLPMHVRHSSLAIIRSIKILTAVLVPWNFCCRYLRHQLAERFYIAASR